MATTSSTQIEWANIAPGKVIVATEHEVWLHTLTGVEDRFWEPMTGAGNIATTYRLLDGAMAAAKLAVACDSRPPDLTYNRLVWQLAGAYQITHATPPGMEKARQNFASAANHSLSNWAADKVQEETGHDQLALLDIQSLGYRAADLVENIFPPAAKVLVDYFNRSVNDSNPIDCVGYTYALERLSLGAKSEHIQTIEAMLPPGVNATRCLRVHSSVGADAEHVEENVEIIAELSSSERTRIVRACYETALLIFSPPQNGYLSSRELEDKLKPFKL
ncbi:MAG: hypothetical protein AAGE84_25560 [Cyanobacteria bacterium P01_G01_bin.39]